MDAQLMVVLSTFPNVDKAAEVAKILVDEGLCACVNVVPGVRSLYRWQGKTVDEPEVLCLLKTRAELAGPLQDRLRVLHPYEVPEVMAVAASRVDEAYLRWVLDSTRPGS